MNESSTDRQRWLASEFVIKIVSRCNLSCTYCYEYTHADQSWRTSPPVMPSDIREMVATRIADYVAEAEQLAVRIVLHGGEPLIAGTKILCETIELIRSRLRNDCQIEPYLQTNGTLLDETSLAQLSNCGFKIGLSLDGPAEANDRSRQFANGRGSHDLTRKALDLISSARFKHSFAGILSVIDLQNDPIGVYSELTQWNPRIIDFLLPDANWTHPPPRPKDAALTYARWLTQIFDHWYDHSGPIPTIRLFEDIIYAILGGQGNKSRIGNHPDGFLTIDTSGRYAGSDLLKSAFEGATLLGGTVNSESIKSALVRAYAVVPTLPMACVGCHVVNICGGGTTAHRYRSKSGFDNPSVYCSDLKELINHIYRRVRNDILTVQS